MTITKILKCSKDYSTNMLNILTTYIIYLIIVISFFAKPQWPCCNLRVNFSENALFITIVKVIFESR